ncbi:hypothetical protein HDU93_007248 [Gonapodya sp. JEL0774]|nr:hypothetical protein HDU93_007248 [Gonapodya sp. JEL0774]
MPRPQQPSHAPASSAAGLQSLGLPIEKPSTYSSVDEEILDLKRQLAAALAKKEREIEERKKLEEEERKRKEKLEKRRLKREAAKKRKKEEEARRFEEAARLAREQQSKSPTIVRSSSLLTTPLSGTALLSARNLAKLLKIVGRHLPKDMLLDLIAASHVLPQSVKSLGEGASLLSLEQLLEIYDEQAQAADGKNRMSPPRPEDAGKELDSEVDINLEDMDVDEDAIEEDLEVLSVEEAIAIVEAQGDSIMHPRNINNGMHQARESNHVKPVRVPPFNTSARQEDGDEEMDEVEETPADKQSPPGEVKQDENQPSDEEVASMAEADEVGVNVL